MTVRSMTVSEAGAVTTKWWSQPRNYIKYFAAVLVVVTILSGLCGYFIGMSTHYPPRVYSEPPDPVVQPPPSWSKMHVFQRGAVCTDAKQCSIVGSEILSKNGSAVDAAVASMFCNGLLNHQSMGIGGGFFMTVYIRDEMRAYSVVAREKAPGAASQDMFKGDKDKSLKGPLAVGVPGEIRGMWAAHQRWGKIPWRDLVAPSLDICKNGFVLSKAMYDGLHFAPYIINDSQLRKMYYDERRKDFFPPGTIVKPAENLCNTLQRIADNGGDDLYNGSLAQDFLRDLQKVGSIITAEDLKGYQAKVTEPIAVTLSNEDVLYTPPPPSSGVILVYILNILSGFGFNPDSITTTDSIIQTYHQILEAFKYAYAMRTKIGDEDFLDLKELIQNISSTDFAAGIRSKINGMYTSNDTKDYGAEEYTKNDPGTAHLSIIAPNGDAVSVTSSINYYYGAGFATYDTGIVLNDVMDDFSSPGITNLFGLKPSPANFIAPGKRPLSSMCPSIIVDKYGNAKLVIGASGGTKITTAIALVTMRKIWFDQSLKEAIDAPRIHHQIFPIDAEYEYGVTEDIISGLRAKGHGMIRYKGRGSVICALYRNKTAIYANADFRKGGDVVGVD